MNKLPLYLAVLLTLPAASLPAASFWNSNSWRPLAGIEGGVAVTSNAGSSKTFSGSPTEEFYSYSPEGNTQTRAIYGGFIGAAWQGCSPWNVQLNVNYMQSSPFSVTGTLTQGIDVASQDTYSYQYKILVRQLLAEGKLSYANSTRFKPYILAGIGPSFNRADSYSTTVPASLTFTREYKNHTTTGFTYAVGAGLDMCLFKCLYAGVSYRFTDFGNASLGSASIDDTSVSGTLSQHHFYANEFLAQLTLLF